MKKLGLVLLPLTLIACSTLPWDGEQIIEEVVINEPYLPEPMQVRVIQVDTSVTPEVYAIAATRVTNKMLDETSDIYENNGATFIYINQPRKMTTDLPDSFHYARKVTRDIIEGSNNFKVVNNQSDADYILDERVTNIGSVEEPIVEFKLILFDNQNLKINEWTETVRQLRNDDRSWW